VRALSGGSIRIAVRSNWRDREPNYEQGLIGDVRAGKTELGIVGVRVLDLLGVPSFQALQAPFLVDTLAAERRALQSPPAARALEAVDRAGVVGLAVLPGTLRRPVGFGRSLVGPGDYRRASFGIRPGAVAAATLAALGGTGRSYMPGDASALTGAELDLSTIASNGYDRLGAVVTSNVTLWPRAQVVVMNRAAFDALTADRQALLRRAGREALEPELARVARTEQSALAELCRGGTTRFASASPAELGALRAAVRPVYDRIGRDPVARAWLAEIEEHRAPVDDPREALRCARRGAPPRTDASRLEGRWTFVPPTVDELVAGGMQRDDAALLVHGVGKPVLVFEHGRHRGLDVETGTEISSGSYEVRGDVLTLVFEKGVAVQLRKPYLLHWSVYRDSLAFSPVAGREPLQALIVKPWTRVR
jgi:TRAP-type C4-dicarboxylate transport system substrate-binding protein